MTTIHQLDTAQIFPGPNDRTQFDANALAELAANIAVHGLIQPITVRTIEGAEHYEIVAGERRFRACTDILRWQTIPAIVADLTDEEAAAEQWQQLGKPFKRQECNAAAQALQFALETL